MAGKTDSGRLCETATHWRARAEEMRAIADDADDSVVRAMMLQIATDCDRVADSTDDRARAPRKRRSGEN